MRAFCDALGRFWALFGVFLSIFDDLGSIFLGFVLKNLLGGGFTSLAEPSQAKLGLAQLGPNLAEQI